MTNILSYIDIKFTKLNSLIILTGLIFLILTISVLILKFTAKESITSQQCIVTINSKKYDVTSFRNEHPGGDIFQCGKDISKEFNAQHNESVLVNVKTVE